MVSVKYMGSKNRHSKDIVNILNQYQYETFIDICVGGANVIDKMNNPIRIGYDINEYLIEMWKAVAKGWLPPKEISEFQYNHIKSNKDEDKILTGYVGFALSYGGKWFGGYRRDKTGIRNYSLESYNSALRQFPKLSGVRFHCETLFNIDVDDCLLYVDPPYLGSTGYGVKFDHGEFYEWCREIGKRNKIFISEYSMPDDFNCVWEKNVYNSLTSDTGSKGNTERLFTL